MDRIVAQDEQLVSISKLDRTGTSDFNAFSCQVIHEKPSDPHAFLSAQILKHAHVSEVFCVESLLILDALGPAQAQSSPKKSNGHFPRLQRSKRRCKRRCLSKTLGRCKISRLYATFGYIWT